MKNNSYRILKLKSGEELITRIAGQKNGNLIIERPMKFQSSTMADPYGRVKEITILKNWLLYASTEKATIPKEFVASFLKPDIDVLKLYELEKRKDDTLKHQKKNRIVRKDPHNSQNNIPSNFQGAEEIEKMMDLFNKYSDDKDMMNNIMNGINNMSEEEMAEMRDEAEDFTNYITMSLYLPPEALMTLVDSGLVDEDQIKEIIDALSQGKTSSEDQENEFPFGEFPSHMGEVDINDMFGNTQFPPIGYKKFNFKDESNNRDPDEYGTHWKDWSPYPDDYLEDRG